MISCRTSKVHVSKEATLRGNIPGPQNSRFFGIKLVGTRKVLRRPRKSFRNLLPRGRVGLGRQQPDPLRYRRRSLSGRARKHSKQCISLLWAIFSQPRGRGDAAGATHAPARASLPGDGAWPRMRARVLVIGPLTVPLRFGRPGAHFATRKGSRRESSFATAFAGDLVVLFLLRSCCPSPLDAKLRCLLSVGYEC